MKKKLFRTVLASTVAACVPILIMAEPALAHERRDVGPYRMTVGWADEPAYTGFKNGVQARLSDVATNEPVVDLAPEELKVEVSFGDETIGPLAMEPRFRVGAFGTPGDYQAALIPSRPGTYTFRFTGTIKGHPVNESFTSGERTFDSPEAPSNVEFPVKDPSTGDISVKLSRTDGRLAEVSDNVDGAGGRATLGLILGLLGVALGGAALTVAKRRPSGPAQTSTAPPAPVMGEVPRS